MDDGVPNYLPGFEPENIKRLLDTFFATLDKQFPDKIIIRSEWNHEKWDNAAAYLCKSLGYAKGSEFLQAYGYQIVQTREPIHDYEKNLEPQNKEKPVKKEIQQKQERETPYKQEKPYKQKKKQKNRLPVIIGIVLILVASVMYSQGLFNMLLGNNISRSSGSGTKIPVINVYNMTLNDAVTALNNAGFTNITSNIGTDSNGDEWFVTRQSVIAGKSIRPEDQITLTCSKKCKLYLDLHSETNLLFSTYDMTVKLDGNEIGTIPNGEIFTYLTEVFNGKHTLYFCKSGSTSPRTTTSIDVSGDLTYSCDLSHGGSSIEIKNEKTNENIDGASLEVIDVTGKVLSEAMSKLKNIGFSNVREEPFGSIWDRDNWIVTKQGVSAGTVVDKNEFIRLDCISLDDYFNNTYVGKNINEIQESSKQSGFSVRFESDTYSDMNSSISKMDQNEKTDWIATRARQYGGADKTAVVTLRYNGVATPSPTSKPVATQKPAATKAPSTPKPAATKAPSTPKPAKTPTPYSYHSSKSKEIAKKGDSGVFAFKSRGGSYAQYYIIDFDAGYVYYFCDGNGDTTGERVKIDSGDLNNGLYVFYHDGSDTWLNILHFKYKNQPDHLILVDHNGFEWSFYQEFLDDALRVKNKKTFYDY